MLSVFIRLKFTFIAKTKEIAFRVTLSGFRGNVRTPGKPAVDFIFVIIELFFAMSYG